MSRCFPFPPPGYVKTARPDGQLASPLLDKEKHKEKKHKKDKKDKDKKEKKDKERSKDKHRDKKDRKEKHKDKKKDKNKDKSRESEGTEGHGDALLGPKFGESSRKSEEIKDPIFREELVRNTQNEKGVENRAVNNFTISDERSREGFSASPALENDRTAVNKMRIHSIDASRKNEGMGQQTITINQQKNGTSIRHSENFSSSSQGVPDGFSTSPMVEKGRVQVTRPLSNSTDSVPRKEGMGQRISNISILVQKRTESPNKETAKREIGTSSPLLRSPANAMHKGNGKVGRPVDSTPTSTQRFESPSTSGAATGMDRSLPRSTIPSPSITIQRPNGMVRPTENFPISTSSKPNAGGVSPAMGKEKGPGGRMLQNSVSTDQKLVGAKPPAVGKEKEPGGRMLHPSVPADQKLAESKPPAVEKIAVGRAERVEKVRDGALADTKKEDRKRDRHEKKKRKEKHKEKKKEKEAKKEKEEHNHKEHDKLRENSINYQIHTLIDSLDVKPLTPPLAPPADDVKVILADESLKKRKNHEMNGYLQNHHEMRTTKLPRPAPSSNHVENGTASHVAAPPSSMKPDAMKIEKAERLPKKEEKINGNKEAQRPSVDSGLRDPLPKKEEKVNVHKEAQQRPSVVSGLRDPLPNKEEKVNVHKEAQQRPSVVPVLRDPLSKKEEKVNVNKEAQQRPLVVSGLRDPLPKKEEKVNGNKEAQQRPSGLRDPGASSGNGAPARKSPHPDFKYLGQIYSIPEAPQIMECDHGDQDWLFDHCSTQPEKPKMVTEADGVPQVWAEAVRIDPADIIALPYVIPF